MKWEPQDVLRLVALLGGFLTFVLGASMMWSGISAEGAIDIKSSFVSGSIKTGSAGLFIVFLSFFLIVFAVAGVIRRKEPEAHIGGRKPSTILTTIFFILLTLIVISVGLASVGYPAFGGLAAFLGFIAAFCGAALLVFLGNES